jgi:hypothetical protein
MVRISPAHRWQDTGLTLDTTSDVKQEQIEAPASALPAALHEHSRLLWRVKGEHGAKPVILKRIEPARQGQASARLSPNDLSRITTWRKGAQASPVLQVTEPTWWDWLRALPGPSTALAVSTLLTALLVAAPLAAGSPKPSDQRAVATISEVDVVEKDIEALPGLARKVREDVVKRGSAKVLDRDLDSLTSSAARVSDWESGLRARADKKGSRPLLDVAAKLAALVTAVLAFCVAYLGLRPGEG